MISSADRRTADLWAITSYFNPVGYRCRLANYRVFRERLTVPLVAVELAYGPDFELNENDAEILVQLRGGDVLWQKERLLNVALGALPKTCRKVVWVDCDIAFDADDWAARVSHMLDRFPFGQPFSRAHYLPPDWTPGKLHITQSRFTRSSIALAVVSGLAADACLKEQEREYPKYATGLCWAARRELLDQHGFYDGCILGSGDRAMVSAGYGCFDHLQQYSRMNDREKARYLAWGKPFHHAVGSAIGFVDGNIYHFWHGEMRDRGHGERHKLFAPFAFDPFEDIVIDQNGCWRWNSSKPEMHAYVKNYFVARNEDG
jgi:hypothetical protein